MAETVTPIPFPTFTYNVDVCYIADKMSRFADEFQLSVSSNVAFMNQFDMARAMGYLGSIDSALAYVATQPQLDLPESHPMQHDLNTFPEQRDLENDEVDHLFRLTRAGWLELTNSQSSRMPAGILAFDLARVTAVVSKARQWLTDYVTPTAPMDLPETAPKEPMSPPGAGGVSMSRQRHVFVPPVAR